MGFLFAWVFVEALLLASFGSTPGKWLLNTRVIAQDGENPSFPKALRRSLGVWWRGLGLGLPLIGLITQISSYSKLKEDGITPWDRAAGLMVTHRKVGFPRMLFTLLILGGVVYLIALAYQYEPLSAEEQLRELLADAEGEIHLPKRRARRRRIGRRIHPRRPVSPSPHPQRNGGRKNAVQGLTL